MNKRGSFIARVIQFSSDQPWLVLFLSLMLGYVGFLSLKAAPLDALPDLSDPQVIVMTEWPGQSPDLVETQVTYPLSTAMLALPQVKDVRGQSFLGVSFVYVIFSEGTDLYWARSRTLEQLGTAELPEGARTQLGPDSSGMGWIFMYALVDEAGTHSLAELRDIQDWQLRYELQSIEDVAEVAAFGGNQLEYRVELDPNRLQGTGLSSVDIEQAIVEGNKEQGGGVLEQSGHEYMLRAKSYLNNKEDIEQLVVGISDEYMPILLKSVAKVSEVPVPSRGLADWNGEHPVVGGIVLMRQGGNALTVIEAVKSKLAQLELPDGVRIEVGYDRSELIEQAISTIKLSLAEELLIVGVLISLFLWHIKTAFVVLIALPLAILISMIPLVAQGVSLNLLSLGGIAVAIGAMVDAAVVLVENVHKRAAEKGVHKESVVSAMQEVGPSIFFSLLILAVSFVPIFSLGAVEGRLFRPLAFSKTYAMLAAAILAISLVPALIVLLFKEGGQGEDRLSLWLKNMYAPVARFSARAPLVPIVGAGLAMALSMPLFFSLEREFMPPLQEGSLLYMPSAPPGISEGEAMHVLQQMDAQIKSVPEVSSVLGKMGRAETATDPAPLGMAETTIVLKDPSEWRSGVTFEDIVQELDELVQVPGMPNLWWMPIQTRLEMLSTGVRTPLALQLLANDSHTLSEASLMLEQGLSGLGRSVVAERNEGGLFLDWQFNEREAARWGISSAQFNEQLALIGGKNVSTLYRERARYPIVLRYAREFRETPEAIQNIVMEGERGLVPFSRVSSMSYELAAPMIRSEEGRLSSFVFIDPGDRSSSELVAAAEERIQQLALPEGVSRTWVGQFQHLEHAEAQLKKIVPIALGVIIVLLFAATGSFVEVGIVLLAVPFSLIGAVVLLWFLNFKLSVAVWVGVLALAGIDAEMGIVMLLYLKLAHQKAELEGRVGTKEELVEVIVEGSAHRIRPKIMTVLSSIMGLLPILWSTGIGSDLMKRIAAPMVGGLVSSFLLELLVYPAIFMLWKGRENKL